MTNNNDEALNTEEALMSLLATYYDSTSDEQVRIAFTARLQTG